MLNTCFPSGSMEFWYMLAKRSLHGQSPKKNLGCWVSKGLPGEKCHTWWCIFVAGEQCALCDSLWEGETWGKPAHGFLQSLPVSFFPWRFCCMCARCWYGRATSPVINACSLKSPVFLTVPAGMNSSMPIQIVIPKACPSPKKNLSTTAPDLGERTAACFSVPRSPPGKCAKSGGNGSPRSSQLAPPSADYALPTSWSFQPTDKDRWEEEDPFFRAMLTYTHGIEVLQHRTREGWQVPVACPSRDYVGTGCWGWEGWRGQPCLGCTDLEYSFQHTQLGIVRMGAGHGSKATESYWYSVNFLE